MRINIELEALIAFLSDFEQATEQKDFMIEDVEAVAAAGLWNSTMLLDLCPFICQHVIPPHIIQCLLELRKASEHVYAVMLWREDNPRARSLDRYFIFLDGMIWDVR